MGKLIKPRGLKGVIKLLVFNEENSSLKPGKKIWIQSNKSDYIYFFIESIKLSGIRSWIKLIECDTKEKADKISGLQFFISRSDFNEINNDELYLFDLIGVSVLDENHSKIGLIVDTIILPTQNLLVVEKHEKELLIPYVDAHVSLFDKKNKILILKNVEGLIN